MERHARRGDGAAFRQRRRGRGACIALLATGLALVLAPSAAADVETITRQFKLPAVGGYEVEQAIEIGAPRPPLAGHMTRMEADIVDANGDPIPISRLMLHHIVFLNLGRFDQTCTSIAGFDGLPPFAPGFERLMAAGEERAKMVLPAGYGYDLTDQTPGVGFDDDPWAVLYMVMNHRPEVEDDAYVRYTMEVDDDPSIQTVVPWWLDVANCSADPIYNVRGDGAAGSTSARSEEFTLEPERLRQAAGLPEGTAVTGGRVVAGGGHVHGGALGLELRQPSCQSRQLFRSTPTWGNPDHPFYQVRPILHEPGPINMSAFKSAQGFSVPTGQPLKLRSVYDDSQPHTRVMGIMIAYVAPVVGQTVDACAGLPTDVETLGSPEPGRSDPVPFTVPITAVNPDTGVAEDILKPPGKTKRLDGSAKVEVSGANTFSERNLSIPQGAEVDWRFTNSNLNLHNVTLANGPRAIGSPNLSRDSENEPRVFSKRFRAPGTYRLFCALHPTEMTERVVVRKGG